MDDVRGMINNKGYSDIYVLYTSNELTDNLKAQFDGNFEKVNIKGGLPLWKINSE